MANWIEQHYEKCAIHKCLDRLLLDDKGVMCKPSRPEEYDCYFDGEDGELKLFKGGTWRTLTVVIG